MKPKVGLRTTRPDEIWHIDTTVIHLLDGDPRLSARRHRQLLSTSARVARGRHVRTGNTVAALLEATRGTTRSVSAPVVVADAGVENVNAQVDALIATGAFRRLLAFTELRFSNSMIEAWWRSLKIGRSGWSPLLRL